MLDRSPDRVGISIQMADNPQWPQRVTLRSNPIRIAILTTLCSIFTIGFAILLASDIFDQPHLDVLATVLILMGLTLFGSVAAGGLYVMRHPNNLVLDADGISLKVLWKRRYFPWGDIASAHVYWANYVRGVALVLTPEGALQRAKGGYFAPMNADIGAGWKGDSELGPEQLATLIKKYLAAFQAAGTTK